MARRLRFAVLPMLAALASPALAQQAPVATFTPNPATQGANVQMGFVLDQRPGCGEVISSTTSVTGNAVRVDYVLGLPPGFVCIGTPPPGTPVLINLGGFAPGNYVVTAVGVDQIFQVPPPVVTGSFGVIASSVSGVPTLSSGAALLLALAALLAGAAILARRGASDAR